MSDDNPPGRGSLAPISLQHKALFNAVFANLAQPTSDYSFANLFVWTAPLKLYWASLHRHLCVFANGTGDLTLLLPPLPEPGAERAALKRALADSWEIMDDYNDRHADRSQSRVEYVSDEMLEQVNSVLGGDLALSAAPMGGDYIYPVGNMIELPGKALKSKRHGKTKFMRDYPDHRAQPLRAEHVAACTELLHTWRRHGDESHEGQVTEDQHQQSTAELRRRDAAACAHALQHFESLGMKGLVLFAQGRLIGFTLGESLSPMQASILFEKTDPAFHGAPQFIFSEFCRQCWADKPEINVGDDWGIPTLRFTKQSYRPTRQLLKYTLTRPAAVPRVLPIPTLPPAAPSMPEPRLPEANAERREPAAPCAAATTNLRAAAITSLSVAVAPTVTAAIAASPVVAIAPPAIPAASAAARVTIRPGQPADIGAILTIEHTCFQPEDAFGPRQVRNLIGNAHAICRVAQNDDPARTETAPAIAGWCVAFIRQHVKCRSGRIYTLAVDPLLQSNGVGRKLLTQVLAELSQRDVRHVYLEVRAANHRAIAMYENFGFHTMRRLPDYYGDGIDGVSMRLTMAPMSRDR